LTFFIKLFVYFIDTANIAYCIRAAYPVKTGYFLKQEKSWKKGSSFRSTVWLVGKRGIKLLSQHEKNGLDSNIIQSRSH